MISNLQIRAARALASLDGDREVDRSVEHQLETGEFQAVDAEEVVSAVDRARPAEGH